MDTSSVIMGLLGLNLGKGYKMKFLNMLNVL